MRLRRLAASAAMLLLAAPVLAAVQAPSARAAVATSATATPMPAPSPSPSPKTTASESATTKPSYPGEDVITVANPGSQFCVLYEECGVEIQASDSLGLALTFSASDLPQGLSIDSEGHIYGLPAAGDQGVTYEIFVSVTDIPAGGYATANMSFYLAISDTITVTSPGNQVTAWNTPVNLQIQARSSAGLPVAYSATGLPPGLYIGDTGLIGGTPTQAGSYPVTVTGTDLSGGSGSAAFVWKISPDTLSVTSAGNQSTEQGAPVMLQVQATSSDGLPLTFSASGLPPGLSIGSSTGLITGTVVTAGSYRVTVTVTDTSGASGPFTFSWTVDAVTVTSISTQSTGLGAPASLQVQAASSAGLPLTYSANGLPPGLSIGNSTGLISGTPTTVGSYTVSVTATG
jgi:hypothetical protein